MTAVPKILPLSSGDGAVGHGGKDADARGAEGTPKDNSAHDLMHVAVVGHVDHGKSTFVGRLFYETGSLPEGRYEEIKATCERRGMPFEWAFLTDALQAERNQGITIDTAQIWFHGKKRSYALLDAPGHHEFLKNMITGAGRAQAAILIIDAAEKMRAQSRRHAYLLSLLGVREIIVVVNKMDLVGYRRADFDQVKKEVTDFLAGIDIKARHILPISAYEGEGIVGKSAKLAWHKGPSLLDALDALPAPLKRDGMPLRFPIQAVYKFDHRRIYAGRIESGALSIGDTLVFSPGGREAKVASIESWNTVGPAQKTVGVGQSVGITLDRAIFIERGHVAAIKNHLPYESNVFHARIFWLGEKSMSVGRPYDLRIGTALYQARLEKIENIINTDDLSHKSGDAVKRNQIAEIVLRTRQAAVFDPFQDNPHCGRFVVSEDHAIVGGGIIDMEGYPDQRRHLPKSRNVFATDHRVSPAQRSLALGHRPAILWMTGLSGSGKSTIAFDLERRLFREGYHVFVLDGDNLRTGLNSDLGFGPDERTENIRRAGEVAALFADAGMIVIAAFISPYKEDRRRARAVRPEIFHEVFINANLDVCEKRDPKGLYKKARRGEIEMFSGISAPYEKPDNPEIVIDTDRQQASDGVDTLLTYVHKKFGRP